MIPRTSPMRQMSAMEIQPGSQAAVGESGSVLSTLLSAPPSEIKAAAAFQQKVIITVVAIFFQCMLEIGQVT